MYEVGPSSYELEGKTKGGAVAGIHVPGIDVVMVGEMVEGSKAATEEAEEIL